jgi:Zn-dependent metalloprotease
MTPLRRSPALGCACCWIAPPFLLDRLIKEGSPEERDAAEATLVTATALRTRRAIISEIVQEHPEVELAATGLLPQPTGKRRSVYDAEHEISRALLPGQLKRAEGDPPDSDDAINEAFDGAGLTYDFYEQVFGRDSIDARGLEIVSSVHFGVRHENAMWTGGQMVYGDGGGQIFVEGSFTKAVDVIAHELTHGITQFTAGLRYRSQPGALNESFSDVFGSLVKQHSTQTAAADADWLIGEGMLKPSLGEALRSMKAPGSASRIDPQPAHMRNYQNLPADDRPENDHGGVHINSGIPNHAFYLAATALGGFAWEKAGRIWYSALTERLNPLSEFQDAASATIDAAADLFDPGSEAQQAVEEAWQQVGVI